MPSISARWAASLSRGLHRTMPSSFSARRPRLGLVSRDMGFRLASEVLAEDDQVVPVGVEVADDGVPLVAVLDVELARGLVLGQRGGLDEEQPPARGAGRLLGVLQQGRPHAARLLALV